jgi:hypothetical protein
MRVTSPIRDMAVDRVGNLWVVGAFSKQISKVSVTQDVAAFALSGVPLAVASDESGVYVVERPST